MNDLKDRQPGRAFTRAPHVSRSAGLDVKGSDRRNCAANPKPVTNITPRTRPKLVIEPLVRRHVQSSGKAIDQMPKAPTGPSEPRTAAGNRNPPARR